MAKFPVSFIQQQHHEFCFMLTASKAPPAKVQRQGCDDKNSENVLFGKSTHY